ncbi:Sortilin, neurotensin receptor 3 [Algoriphagus halophilus]|uniref:Sortilin, neurotensin receptor 3 n=1 Tax=Algoriphagus halophilus TaxID=226505 RepID=A0A1N6DU89_9BACT|nr:Sortilin, neurotensin receptor 3 [Algoriphagus halophilus]
MPYFDYLSNKMRILPVKFILLLFMMLYSSGIFAQQPSSPLVASFESYRQMKEETTFKLDWISLGPTVNSARADIVQVDETNPGTMYVGFGSGGIWKTTNHGVTWSSIFDEQSSIGIGDMELAPSDPNIIYLGTGENLKKPRNFTLPGTGMFRSDDAGETWEHIGLEDSWSISEIEIHPTNPDIVFVAVLGHLWTKNENRGLYRTMDGGKTWEQVLYKDELTGANEVQFSPSDPQVMYASLWEVYPGISGENSGVYRSKDGGTTWELCTNGLPNGPKIGRIGLTVSNSNPDKAYALIDNLNNARNEAAELYKTIDGGLTWTKTHSGPFKIFPGIGWYFTDVYVNPENDEEVFCLGVRLAHSMDGGKTFSYIGGQVSRMNPSLAQGLHLDQCELWINPTNPNHLALGNDGGFYVSYDKGLTWVHYNNIPTGEFYDITIDQANYTIYGGTQDDATVYGPAKELNTRFPDPWKYVWIDPWDGGDGCVTQIDPVDPSIIYYSRQHGDAMRLDKSVDEAVSIMPRLPEDINDTLVFNYMTPYFLSKYDHQTLYHGGNYLMKSTDRGDTWDAISPNFAVSSDPGKQSFATGDIAQSPIKKEVLYAGTDHGAFWVSKDEGATWEENSIGIANNYIRSISPSHHQVSRVYMAMTGINYDDLKAYVYASEDDGKTWKSIASGLPDEPVNVIKEDPRNENILYLGGMRGVYVSIDRGQNWSYLGVGMPAAAVADLEFYEPTMDLVVATHGRGIYKTNLQPIHEMLSQNLSTSTDHFFEIHPTPRPWFNSSSGDPDYRTVEKATFSFWLNQPKRVNISIFDESNNKIWGEDLTGSKGFNQLRWDLVVKKQSSDAPYFVHYERFIQTGKYTVKLSSGDQTLEQTFDVVEPSSPYLVRDGF